MKILKKPVLLFFLVLMYFAILAGFMKANAQEFRKTKTGQIIKVTPTKDTTNKDKVYAVVDNVTFYQGPKGGIYYYKLNKKLKRIKCYVKPFIK